MKKVLSAIALSLSLALATGCATTTTSAPVAAKPASYERAGFVTRMQDGRLWVFKEGASELKNYDAHGELAVHIVRPAAGPGGITLKAPDAETADAYMATWK